MHSCDIFVTFKGELSRVALQDKLKKQWAIDLENNGYRDGYSGDFQTVERIDFRLHETFPNFETAMDYCLEHAVRFSTVVAVHYKHLDATRTMLAGYGAC